MLDENVVRMLSANSDVRSLATTPFPGSDYQPPVVTAVKEQYNLHEILQYTNIYTISDGIYRRDGDVSGIVNRYGHMCKMAYGGIFIEAGKTLDTGEEDLLQAAKDCADLLDFEAEFLAIGIDMIKDGDVVKHMVWDKDGVSKLQALPRRFLTAVKDVGQTTTQYNWITEINKYVLFERTAQQEIFEADTCVHFAMNNKSQFVSDILSRTTFGVWSVPPLEPLLGTIEWKVNAVINDILWTHRNVPREHHRLDLSMYIPENYSGTPQERQAQAEAAGQAAADAYSASISNQNSDVAYITDAITQIGFVEPKSTNYQSPNEKLRQINEGIANALGMAPIMRDQSFAGAVMSGSFAMLNVESIAKIIRRGMLKILRHSIRVKYGPRFADEDLMKLKMRIKLILEKDKTEVMRQIAIMDDSGKFTPTEIRAEWGKEPLTDKDIEEIARFQVLMEKEKKKFTSVARVAADTVRGVNQDQFGGYPIAPSDVGRRDAATQ